MSSQDLRSLPPVDALAAEVDAPRPVALAAARSVLASRRAAARATGRGASTSEASASTGGSERRSWELTGGRLRRVRSRRA